MPMQIGGSDANVTVDNEITSAPVTPAPNSDQTVVNAYYQASDANAHTAYTVTAGKTFYLMGCTINNNAAANNKIMLTDASTTVVKFNSNATVNSFALSGTAPIAEYAAGEFVKVQTDNPNCNFIIWGIEQ